MMNTQNDSYLRQDFKKYDDELDEYLRKNKLPPLPPRKYQEPSALVDLTDELIDLTDDEERSTAHPENMATEGS